MSEKKVKSEKKAPVTPEAQPAAKAIEAIDTVTPNPTALQAALLSVDGAIEAVENLRQHTGANHTCFNIIGQLKTAKRNLNRLA